MKPEYQKDTPGFNTIYIYKYCYALIGTCQISKSKLMLFAMIAIYILVGRSSCLVHLEMMTEKKTKTDDSFLYVLNSIEYLWTHQSRMQVMDLNRDWYIVECQRGRVSEQPLWFQAATRHGH